MAWGFERSEEADELAELGPYLGIARQLKANVDARIADAGLDPATAVAAVCDAQEEATVRGSLQRLLEKMPLEAVLEQYASRLGVAAVNEVLERVGRVRVLEAERNAKIDAISYEAKVSRQLDLRHLDVGEVVEIGLFAASQQNKSYANKTHVARSITARLRDTERAELQTLTDVMGSGRDSWSETANDYNVMPSHTPFHIGTLVDEEYPSFTPVLSANTTPNIRIEGRPPFTTIYQVGYVSLGETVLLDSPVPMA